MRSETAVDVVEIYEMHTYISSKKTTAGYGLLLIDLKKGSSIASWVIDEQPPDKSCGMPHQRY